MPVSFWPLDSGLLLPLQRPRARRLLVTPFEDGPPEVRLRNLAAPAMLTGSLRLTGAQLATFEAWGEGILQDWSLPFRWNDPKDCVDRVMQFAGEPGTPTMDTSAAAGFEADRTAWLVPVTVWVLE